MMLKLSSPLVPAAMTVLLVAGASLVATTPTATPRSSALLRVWTDMLRDIDLATVSLLPLSPAEEKRLGDQIALRIYMPTGGDIAAKAYVESVGKTVLAAAGPQPFIYSFDIISSGDINAFALPGGHVYVTTGLLDNLKSEAQLAAVLGHEISHVMLGHCIRRLQYHIAAERIGGSDIAGLIDAAHDLLASSYAAEDETEADENGVLLAARAGYDPHGASQALAVVALLESESVRGAQTMIGELVSGVAVSMDIRSHPVAAQRIGDVEAVSRRNSSGWDGQTFYVGARNLLELTPEASTRYPEETVVFPNVANYWLGLDVIDGLDVALIVYKGLPKYPDGSYEYHGSGKWTEKTSAATFSFVEKRRTASEITLWNALRSLTVIISVKLGGEVAWVYQGGPATPFGEVTKLTR